MKRISLFVLMIMSGLSFAQNAKISGTVHDDFDKPLDGASVVLQEIEGGEITDFYGKFVIENLASGTYHLKVSHMGFETYKSIVKLSDGQNLELKISLKANHETLQEVVVSAGRTLEKLSEIPSSVSVINSKQVKMLAQHSNTLADIVANIPGVALSTNTTTTRGQNIRGRNILVLIDGIPQSTPLFVTNRDLNTIDSSVIERVEIIKGSTSIYGNGAEGGIINYITKKGDSNKKLESYTNLGTSGSLVNTDNTIGSSMSQLFKGQINNLNYIVSGSFKETGIMRSAKNEISSPMYGLGETESYNVFTKIGYHFNDKNKIELMYNYFSSNQDSSLKRVNGVYGETPVTGIFGEKNPEEMDQGTKYNHNIKLKYTSNNIFKNTNLGLSLYSQNFATVYGYTSWFADILSGEYDGGQSQVTSYKRGARLNLNTSYVIFDTFKGNLVYGLDFMGDQTEQTLVDKRVWTPKMDMNNFAPYLQIKTKYKGLIFKGGTRYENINIGVNDYTTLIVNSEKATQGGVDINGDTLKYSALTFNLGLRYNNFKYFKPFASFSQSFSVGELRLILRGATDPKTISGQINTEAVVANNYEFGFVSDLTSKIKFQGLYFISTSTLGSTYLINPKTDFLELSRLPEKVYGIELQLNAELTDNFNFGVSLATIEGKTDNNDNKSFNDDEDKYMSGMRINPSIFRGHIGYQISPKWNARLTSTFSGNRARFDPNEEGEYSYGEAPVNSFNVTNLFSSYDLTSNTKLVLGIENLFNKDYYTVRSQWAARDKEYEKGNGINFKLSLNVHF